jgi:hypothetical protein
LTHDAIFVKVALSDLFASNLWQSFKITRLALWCDNAPHFRNKVLLAYLLDLCEKKEFQEIFLCYFEPYHGKSAVDSMFGVMTKWINTWIKTRYLNTTKDLLECFHENNKFLSTPQQNLFYELSLNSNLWTQIQQNIISNISLKTYNYFHFSIKFGKKFKAIRYGFKILNTTGAIECSGLIIEEKTPNIIRQVTKRNPKYSKNIEVANSNLLTPSDEEFLKKKAKVWGLKYKTYDEGKKEEKQLLLIDRKKGLATNQT